MPTVQQHIAQWQHNRRFAATIDRACRDWQVTAIFYAALHAVDAALTHLNNPVSDHAARNEAVKRNASLANVRNPYLNLYRISKVTRYDADPTAWLPQQYLSVNDLVDQVLRPIENEVARLSGRDVVTGTLRVED